MDTGAIYRTIGCAVRRRDIDPGDRAAVVAALPELDIGLTYGADGLQHMELSGEDVTAEIRLPEISRYASVVSAYPEVRAYLLEMQRRLAREHSVIMDGLERHSPGRRAPAAGGGRGAAGYHGAGFYAERGSPAADHPGKGWAMNEEKKEVQEKRPLNGFFVFVYYLVTLVANILHPVTVIGRENLPEHSALLCPNHNSNWDPVLVALKVPVNYRLHIMAKKELFCNKVFDWVLRKLGAFPVDRGEGDIEAVKNALKAIKSGDNLLIFPEGTRVEHEGDLPAKGGVAVIGIRSGAQFVPVYVEGNKRIFRRTRIIFGQAYRPDAASRRPSPEEVQAIADEVLRRAYALGRET